MGVYEDFNSEHEACRVKDFVALWWPRELQAVCVYVSRLASDASAADGELARSLRPRLQASASRLPLSIDDVGGTDFPRSGLKTNLIDLRGESVKAAVRYEWVD